jgi:hypothetical protein
MHGAFMYPAIHLVIHACSRASTLDRGRARPAVPWAAVCWATISRPVLATWLTTVAFSVAWCDVIASHRV